jgi:hypothetical protein
MGGPVRMMLCIGMTNIRFYILADIIKRVIPAGKVLMGSCIGIGVCCYTYAEKPPI